MKQNNWDSIWFKEVANKGYEIVWQHSKRLRQNKEMLIEKWRDFYFKKYREKYMFSNIKEVKNYLDENIDWFCEFLENNILKDLKTIKDGETLFDYDKKSKVNEFWRDFHEILYDLEEYDPIVEAEKMRNQSKTKKEKNKIVTKLINALKRKK